MDLVNITPPLREMTSEQLEDLMTAAQEEKKNREARRFKELRMAVTNAIAALVREFPDAILENTSEWGYNMYAENVRNIYRYSDRNKG